MPALINFGTFVSNYSIKMKKISLAFALFIGLFSIVAFTTDNVGEKVDELNGVAVYANGTEYLQSHGRHFATDGYYYGKKWQCVEFVKRYYYDHYEHKFPNTYGHAKDFWDLNAAHGASNKARNLVQYYNDNDTKPEVGDLVCFPFSEYGHVAIVSKVTDKTVEVIQQNIKGKTRETYDLTSTNGKFGVTKGKNKPIGWLRKK